MRRYTKTLTSWSISLEVNGIELLQNLFLAISSIEMSTIQHRKKLVTKLLDYFSVRGGVIKPGFSEPGFHISALIFIFLCILSLSYTRIAKTKKRCQTDERLWRYGSAKIFINLIQREIIS